MNPRTRQKRNRTLRVTAYMLEQLESRDLLSGQIIWTSPSAGVGPLPQIQSGPMFPAGPFSPNPIPAGNHINPALDPGWGDFNAQSNGTNLA